MKMKKGLLTMLALLSMGSSAFAQGTVNVPTVTRNVNGEPGPVKEVSVVASRQGTVKIELTEFTNYRDLQFDLTLPEGITVVSENEVIQVETAKTSHKVAANAVADNKVRFVVYNEGNVDDDENVIKLGDGIIVEIPVNVAAGFEGEVETSLDGILTSDDAATKSIEIGKGDFKFRAVLLGDVNDSGTVTNSDQVAIVMHLLDEPSTPFVFEAADMEYNASKPNEITNADAINLADKLLSSSAKAFMEEEVVNDVETEIEPD